MKCSAEDPIWVDEVDSTQDLIAARVLAGDKSSPIVMAGMQNKGRGRLGRIWLDEPGKSLLVSVALWDYSDHPKPWLLGMGMALAAAGALQTQVRWPNDLTIGGLKVGGILTELYDAPGSSKVPVIGLGVNLAQSQLPSEIASKATSLRAARGHEWSPENAWRAVMNVFQTIPEPNDWDDLKPVWEVLDDTPGKRYMMPDGREAVALGLGPGGHLIASVAGETVSILAAEALFGTV
ncbi:MAG: biotin--[acetyl-CoA-carboxylase] ligase [Armatimonadota bacterium]